MDSCKSAALKTYKVLEAAATCSRVFLYSFEATVNAFGNCSAHPKLDVQL